MGIDLELPEASRGAELGVVGRVLRGHRGRDLRRGPAVADDLVDGFLRVVQDAHRPAPHLLRDLREKVSQSPTSSRSKTRRPDELMHARHEVLRRPERVLLLVGHPAHPAGPVLSRDVDAHHVLGPVLVARREAELEDLHRRRELQVADDGARELRALKITKSHSPRDARRGETYLAESRRSVHGEEDGARVSQDVLAPLVLLLVDDGATHAALRGRELAQVREPRVRSAHDDLVARGHREADVRVLLPLPLGLDGLEGREVAPLGPGTRISRGESGRLRRGGARLAHSGGRGTSISEHPRLRIFVTAKARLPNRFVRDSGAYSVACSSMYRRRRYISWVFGSFEDARASMSRSSGGSLGSAGSRSASRSLIRCQCSKLQRGVGRESRLVVRENKMGLRDAAMLALRRAASRGPRSQSRSWRRRT